jgi:XisI protein
MALEYLAPSEQTHPSRGDSIAQNDRYRQQIKRFLLGQSDSQRTDRVVSVPIFDEVRDQYLVLCYGWRGQERVYWVVLHLEIVEGKVWIQRNQTEVDVEAELKALGIAENDLVRGLVPPDYRALVGLNG